VQPLLESKKHKLLHILTIIYTQCAFVALVILHLIRMFPIILPSVACLAVPHYLKKLHDFQRKID